MRIYFSDEHAVHAPGDMPLPTVLVQEGGYLSEHLGGNLAAALTGFEEAR